MTLWHLAISISLVSSLPPLSQSAALSTGDIVAAGDHVLFKIGPDLYYLALFYTVDPHYLEGKGFTAELKISKPGAKPYTEKWKKTVNASSVLYIVDYKDVVLSPGNYTVELKLRSGAQRQGLLSFYINVPEDTGLSLSDVMFVSGFYANPDSAPFARSGVGFLPNPTRAFWGDTLFYYFEIYDMADDTGRYLVSTAVLDSAGNPVLASKPKIRQRKGRTGVEAGKMDISSLDFGEFVFAADVVDMTTKKKVQVRKTFARTRQTDVYATPPVYSFIQYIASQEEIKEFKACKTPKQRSAFLKRFWASRDPDPSTPQNEFYERFQALVRYADQHFSHVNTLGRYTDMGRIYIKYGPPDEVQREEVPRSNKSNIRWLYYSHNWEYLFADPDETGEFRLIYSTNPMERPSLYYEKPATNLIDQETEEWYWPW